jgi:HK97 family phage major capsid protein
LDLPPSVANLVFQGVKENSAIQQLAIPHPMGGPGEVIPIITSDITPGFVNETDPIPVSNVGVSQKSLTPKTISAISTFSNKFRRDWDTLYDAIVARTPSALAKSFDMAVLTGKAANGTSPGAGFDTFASAPSVNITSGTYAAFVDAQDKVVQNDGDVSGWAMSPRVKKTLLSALDGSSRPIFIQDAATQGAPNQLLGLPIYFNRGLYQPVGSTTPACYGVGGDWSACYYGVVQNLSVTLSDQIAVTIGGTLTSLWEREMFAVKAVMEVGFVYKDVNLFCKLCGPTP